MRREWQRQVTNTQAGRRVGMLWMDVTEMLNGLKRALERAMSVLCMVLEVSSHNKLSTVLAHVQGAVKRIKERPGALLPFSEYLVDYTAIQGRQEELLAGSAAVKVCWPVCFLCLACCLMYHDNCKPSVNMPTEETEGSFDRQANRVLWDKERSFLGFVFMLFMIDSDYSQDFFAARQNDSS
jgi:hypothetical protein